MQFKWNCEGDIACAGRTLQVAAQALEHEPRPHPDNQPARELARQLRLRVGDAQKEKNVLEEVRC